MTQTAMSLQLSAGVQSILYVIFLFSGCYEHLAYFLLFFFWFILSAIGGILALVLFVFFVCICCEH